MIQTTSYVMIIVLSYTLSIIFDIITLSRNDPNGVYKNVGLISIIIDILFSIANVLYYGNEYNDYINTLYLVFSIIANIFYIKKYYEPNNMTDDITLSLISITFSSIPLLQIVL